MRIVGLFVLILVTAFCANAKKKEPTYFDAYKDGLMLYRSEMASWYGSDIFKERYKPMDKVGGYFSYVIGGEINCIFYSKSTDPKVIGTITFDSSFDVLKTKVDLIEREFTGHEKRFFDLRSAAVRSISNDTFFLKYKNTNLNLIPLVADNKNNVYILTGPEKDGVVIFGNDYLLTFDNNYKLTEKKRLHHNIISIDSSPKADSNNMIMSTVHSHSPETGDFITATDICTLMLYEKFTTWQQHYVVSKNYITIWDCKKDELNVLTMKVWKKINEDIKRRNNK